MHSGRANPTYRRDLGDGLVLRWSTGDDASEIVYLTSMVFRQGPDAPPSKATIALAREVAEGRYPSVGVGDVAVVEDTRRREHRLVCCTCLWRMTWEYEGIPFTIGRPEIVATDSDYRHRGLVRAVFELVHARSEAEGHLAQGITGIPYFYRQFGYEYALDLDARRTTHFALIPKAREDAPEPFTLRDATAEDIPFIQEQYDQRRTNYSVSSRIPPEWWHYQVQTMRRINAEGFWLIQVIVDQQGTRQGYVIMMSERWSRSIPVLDLTTVPDINLQMVMPSLLRAIQAQAADFPAPPHTLPAERIRFALPTTHPAYNVLGKELAIETELPYAWYVRVPDLPRFIRHVAPALERRLASSPLASYSGTPTLNFYRGGLQLAFEQGKLTGAENWRAPLWGESEDAWFPPLVFLQLLFGWRSLEQLQFAFPDVQVKNEVKLLLKTLFPAKPSWVIPMG